MFENVGKTLLGWGAASLAWFICSGALYMNPITAKIYKDAEVSPGLKKWPNTPKYVGFQLLGIVFQNLLWAFVFVYVKPVLPQSKLAAGLAFGIILILVKIIPRAYDMWIQTTYPNKLLLIELINGSIGSIIIGIAFSYII